MRNVNNDGDLRVQMYCRWKTCAGVRIWFIGLNATYEKPNRRARKQTLRTSNSIDTESCQKIASAAGTLGYIVFLGRRREEGNIGIKTKEV